MDHVRETAFVYLPRQRYASSNYAGIMIAPDEPDVCECTETTFMLNCDGEVIAYDFGTRVVTAPCLIVMFIDVGTIIEMELDSARSPTVLPYKFIDGASLVLLDYTARINCLIIN